MDYNNINKILDKYWEGETSLQEEQTLHHYFNSGEVADELKEIQPLFVYFQEEQATCIENSKFDEALIAQLETTIVQPMQLQPKQKRRRRVISLVSRAAAIVLLVIGSMVVYQNVYQEQSPVAVNEPLQLEDLSEEERLAYEQTKAALAYLSSKLNRGTKIATDNLMKVSKKTEQSLK